MPRVLLFLFPEEGLSESGNWGRENVTEQIPFISSLFTDPHFSLI
jgi:hypothetical protein